MMTPSPRKKRPTDSERLEAAEAKCLQLCKQAQEAEARLSTALQDRDVAVKRLAEERALSLKRANENTEWMLLNREKELEITALNARLKESEETCERLKNHNESWHSLKCAWYKQAKNAQEELRTANEKLAGAMKVVEAARRNTPCRSCKGHGYGQCGQCHELSEALAALDSAKTGENET